MKIRPLPGAERDLEIGAGFYESQQLGLGSYFNDCLIAETGQTHQSLKQLAYAWGLAKKVPAVKDIGN
jgi:hypothetical protein